MSGFSHANGITGSPNPSLNPNLLEKMTPQEILEYNESHKIQLQAMSGIKRSIFLAKLFSGAPQVGHFRNLHTYFNTNIIPKSENPISLKVSSNSYALPGAYTYQNQAKNLPKLLAETETTGLMVLKNNEVVFEDYYLGNSSDTKVIVWSVTKSMVSLLVGKAVELGYIESIDDLLIDYIPELNASDAYKDVTIRDVLTMSSGARWDETYWNPLSEIRRFSWSFLRQQSMKKFILSMKSEFQPGTKNRYNTMDTQVLGWLLKDIMSKNGSSLLEFAYEHLWNPLGIESEALIIADEKNFEFVGGGMLIDLPSLAKIGSLLLNDGEYQGKEIIQKEWIRGATRLSKEARLQPGISDDSDSEFGYGFQFWIPEGNQEEFLAIGIYGQFIYVNPTTNTVIVKSSAFRDYDKEEVKEGEDPEKFKRETEQLEMFRTISSSLNLKR